MTATLAEHQAAQDQARQAREARERGLSLAGPQRLPHGRPAPEAGDIRTLTRPKTMLTQSSGRVQLDMPQDQDEGVDRR